MKRFGVTLVVISFMFACGAAWAGDADSAATRDQLNQTGEPGLGQADSTRPAVADTLAPGVIGERGVLGRLILPALVTAALGGLLILLFTQRG